MISETDWDKAPAPEVFDDIKQAAISLWRTYDNTYGYVDKKLQRIVDLPNYKDNYIYIIQMFDHPNRCKLMRAVQTLQARAIIADLLNY